MEIQRTTTEKLELHKIIFLIALILGGIIRFMPVVMAGFPVNDGGMFYVMVEELIANHFLLPVFTQYNLANIPYAYPPLGFYVTALISNLFRIPVLDVIRWLPPVISTLSLLAFYLLANEILGSNTQAALATLFYGLVPDSFGWAIMGGGITRTFGILFLFLTIAVANRLYTRTSGLHAALAAAFGAIAFLSHPETGLQAAAACILLWLFRGRSKNTFLWSILVVFGVIALTAPWWGTVVANHGTAPFQSAIQTSDDGVFHFAELLMMQFGGGIFFSLTVAMGLVGLLAVLAQRRYLIPTWIVLPFVVDPRSAGGMVLIPLSFLAAYAFDRVLAPALLSLREREGVWLNDRFVALSMFGMAFYLFFGSSVFGLGLAESSLSVADRETIAWVDANIPSKSNFLLLTGEQYSMKDPFQEWFPALTTQHSQTTLQGAEWNLYSDFFPRYGELVTLQHCADVDCVDLWAQRTKLNHQYLLIKSVPKSGLSSVRRSLTLLLESVQGSTQYENIYKTEYAEIYKFVGDK